MKRTIIILLLAAVAVGAVSAQKQKKERKAPFFRNAIITVEGDTILCDVLNHFDDHYEIDVFDPDQRKRTIRVAKEYVSAIVSSAVVPEDRRGEGRGRAYDPGEIEDGADASSGATRKAEPATKPIVDKPVMPTVPEENGRITAASPAGADTAEGQDIRMIVITTMDGSSVSGRLIEISSDNFAVEVVNATGDAEIVRIPVGNVKSFEVK